MLISATRHAKLLKQLPSWLYKIGAQAYIDRVYPRHLFIETTADCNLHCTYCPREKLSNHMDFRLFQSIVDEASGYGARSFSLHLFGEPLLYPRWFEAIRYIKQRNPRHTVLLTTNGTRLNTSVDELIRSGVDKVLWSWRPEVRFRQETLRKLRGWKPFTVRIIEEVTPEEEKREWGNWPNVEWRHVHNYGGKIDTSRYQVKDDRLTPISNRWFCYHLDYAPAIAWNGDILICCADPTRESKIGRFPEMSVSEAWRSKTMDRLRKEQLNGIYSGICKNCNVWKSYPNTYFGHEFSQEENKEIS